jgi:hypothetical protein
MVAFFLEDRVYCFGSLCINIRTINESLTVEQGDIPNVMVCRYENW